MSWRLARCDRATASVEAVVILPFLVLLFAGGLHVYGVASAHQQSEAAARKCAWAHALAGCPREAPPQCREGKPEGDKGASGGAEALAEVGVNSNDFVQDLGFLGRFVQGLVGRSFATTRSAEVQALMDPDGRVQVSARQVLLCNPTPPKFGKFLKEIFSARDRLGKGKGG